MKYVILAGGRGSRFVEEGCECPKPLIPIFGQPMIGRLIRMLMKFDAEEIYVGANARMQPLPDYLEQLRQEGLPVVTRPIITDNSFCTLRTAAEGIKGKFIAMTCDAIFADREFGGYVKAVEGMTDDEAVMGLTRFVEDESPLYAKLNESGEVVDYKYGGVPFPGPVIVSAGLYGLSDRSMNVIKVENLEPQSLSDFQRILASATPIRVLPYEFEIAFDVDNSHDRRHAEEFLSSQGPHFF